MASEKEAEAAAASNRAPAAASTEPTSDGDAKEIKVLSVELADAVAKDKPNYKSWAQISLYMFMLLNTLSEYYHPLRMAIAVYSGPPQLCFPC